MHPFSTPWKPQKTFSGGREKVHWEQMGYIFKKIIWCKKKGKELVQKYKLKLD